MKNKIVYILIIIVMVLLAGLSFYNAKQIEKGWHSYYVNAMNTTCKNPINEDVIKTCNRMKETKYNAVLLYSEVSSMTPEFGIITKNLSIYIVLVFSILSVHKYFKNNYLKNIIQRKNYSKFIKKEYFKCILKSSFFPLFLILILFVSCFLTKTFYDPNIDQYFFDKNLFSNSNIYIFFLHYFINVFLYFSFISCICFFYLNISNNYLIVMLKSVVTFYILDLFASYVLGTVINYLTGAQDWDSYLLISNTLYGYNQLSLSFITIYLIILIGIVTFINYKKYSNQERILIRNEE